MVRYACEFQVCVVLIIELGLCQGLHDVSFLQGVTYVYETGRNESRAVVLCKSTVIPDGKRTYADESERKGHEFLIREQCGDNANDSCRLEGKTECVDLSSISTGDFYRILSQYDEIPTQRISFALENGQSFFMYVVLNDTVSTELLTHGSFAPILTAIVHNIARDGCSPASTGPKLVVDVGCNLGLVSLIALAHGCDAVCIEPNGALVPVVARSILRNAFPGSAAVIHAAAAAVWQEVVVASCGAACDAPRRPGAAPPGGGAHALAWGEVRGARRGDGTAAAAPLDRLLRGRALLLKVDVEGLERLAGLGLNRWLREAGWAHLLLEARPGPARPATLAVFLQGCAGRPRIRAWRERYYGPAAAWAAGALPLAEVDFAALAGPGVPEDLWVACEDPAAAAAAAA
jgi:FkbM family methyltransferase